MSNTGRPAFHHCGGGPGERFPVDATTPSIMTIAEVAQYLRIPRASVYKLAQKGSIPCQKVGRHWRFRREAIDRWLERPCSIAANGHLHQTTNSVPESSADE